MLIFKPHGASLLDYETSWGFSITYTEGLSCDSRKQNMDIDTEQID